MEELKTENKEVTLSQIEEVLNRLREYTQWMYYGEDCVYLSGLQEIEHGGHKFSINVLPNGLYEVNCKDAGVKGIYEAVSNTAELRRPGTLDNIEYKAKIANKEEIPEGLRPWFEEATIFVLSFFQRTHAFIFLARMQDSSLENIARHLNLMVKKS